MSNPQSLWQRGAWEAGPLSLVTAPSSAHRSSLSPTPLPAPTARPLCSPPLFTPSARPLCPPPGPPAPCGHASIFQMKMWLRPHYQCSSLPGSTVALQ